MGAMTDTLLTSQLMTPLYASTAMRAIMNDRARLQRMLDFEAALARAEAAVGVIGATAAVVIGDGCDAAHYDIAALVEAQAPSGNIAIAVVNMLTQAVAARDREPQDLRRSPADGDVQVAVVVGDAVDRRCQRVQQDRGLIAVKREDPAAPGSPGERQP